MDHELLRVCAGANLSEESRTALRSLAREVDWDNVLEQAQRHGLIPLLYRQVARHCADLVPRRVLHSLSHAYVVNAAHNLRLTAELLRILALLENAGVPVVPFKGPVLADLLFNNISLRQFADLDILVPKKFVGQARQLLLDDGYSPEFVLDAKDEKEYIRSEHAFQFRKQAQGFVIELHWRFGSRNQVFPLRPEHAWTRLSRRHFQGTEILTLSPEDLLLYLCVHGAKHGWDRLEWIVCLSALLRSSTNFDWESLLLRARGSGALRALHLGLLLVAGLAPIDLPQYVLEGMAEDLPAHALADHAQKQLFVDEQDHAKREIYRQTFYLRTRERWSDRMRILLHFSIRIPHPLAKDWSVFKVPASLTFLYYLLRPMRLMREYGFHRLRAMVRANTSF